MEVRGPTAAPFLRQRGERLSISVAVDALNADVFMHLCIL